jgi:membrane protein implicated in regulation of membrane protease activity
MNDSLQKEIDELKKLPKSKLKRQLLLYRILLFLNSDNFTFVFSLLTCLIPLLFFPISILVWLGVLLLHYFIFWKKVKPYLDQKFDTEKNNEEMRGVLNELKKKNNF